MNGNDIRELQLAVGVKPDGFWGPKSVAACQKHLRSLMPYPHPFPKANDDAMRAFYGEPGKVRLVKVALPFEIRLYDDGQVLSSISIHERLGHSLMRVLEHVLDRFPDGESRKDTGITRFFGSYAVRPMRGGASWSKHAWAAAVDFDANRNGNHTHWPTRARMPLEIMECFAREGWLAAGAFWGRDAMHFQATQ